MTGFLHQDWVRVPVRPGRVEGWVIVGIVVAALVWSGIEPYDRGTWFLEIVWILIGLPLVLLFWRRFPLCTVPATYALASKNACAASGRSTLAARSNS